MESLKDTGPKFEQRNMKKRMKDPGCVVKGRVWKAASGGYTSETMHASSGRQDMAKYAVDVYYARSGGVDLLFHSLSERCQLTAEDCQNEAVPFSTVSDVGFKFV